MSCADKCRSIRSGVIFGLVSLCPILKACVAVPTAIPEAVPFREDVETRVVIGETGQQEITTVFGTPISTGDGWWLYSENRAGWGVAACSIDYIGCTSDRNSTPYYLFIQFGPTQTVSEYDVVRSSELCSRRRICFRDGHMMQAASESADDASKTFLPSPNHCAIYVYSNAPESFLVSQNGRDLGNLVNHDAYFMSETPASEHVMTVQAQAGYFSREITVSCESEQVNFINIDYSMFGGVKLVEASEGAGQRAIQSRWLALP